MKQYDSVVWKTKIPKKLYNKITYYIKRFGSPRSDFLNFGFDYLTLKYTFHQDFPDPETLYRFSEEDEADLVTWQVRISKSEALSYDDFMKSHGVTGRDALAMSLYKNKY